MASLADTVSMPLSSLFLPESKNFFISTNIYLHDRKEPTVIMANENTVMFTCRGTLSGKTLVHTLNNIIARKQPDSTIFYTILTISFIIL